MTDKQNGRSGTNEISPEREKESTREKETPRSYYYDDATGYEIYEAEDDNDKDVDKGQSD